MSSSHALPGPGGGSLATTPAPRPKRSNTHHNIYPGISSKVLLATSSSNNDIQPSVTMPSPSANIHKHPSSSLPPLTATGLSSFSSSSSPSSASSSPSSASSASSLASLASSASPSSIISLQRNARQEKRHFHNIPTIYKEPSLSKRATPTAKAKKTAAAMASTNQPAILPAATTILIEEPEKVHHRPYRHFSINNEKHDISAATDTATTTTSKALKRSRSTTAGSHQTSASSSTAKNRLSSWASSFRQSLTPTSKKSDAGTAATAAPSTPSADLASIPESPTSSPQALPPFKYEHSSTDDAHPRNSQDDHSPAALPQPVPYPNYTIKVENTHHHHHIQHAHQVDTLPAQPKATKVSRWAAVTSAAANGSSSTSSFSPTDQPRIRLLKQSRRRKIGSGLITIFCIIAIVILIVLC